MPEMRRVTVRFGESLWTLIEDEANQDGVSAAQWIRDAAIARALWERSRRGEPNGAFILEVVRAERRLEDERRAKLIHEATTRARTELEAVIRKLTPETAQYVRDVYGV